MTDRDALEHDDEPSETRDEASQASRDDADASGDEEADSGNDGEGLTEWGNLPSDDQTWTAHSSPLRKTLAWGCLIMLALGVVAMIVLLALGKATP